MADKTTVPLPLASTEYDELNESITRRTLEQAIQDLNSEIGNLKRLQESIASKSIRRHQFLLMGVKHG
jgi:hypothetical protein|tara:strand:- start:223 stop:426 length:204 start_codon:yes stop_codon:yes gene_type:complete